MKKIKKVLSLLLVICMTFVLFAGCGDKDETSSQSESEAPQTTSDSSSADGESANSDERPMEGNLYLEGTPIVKEKETYKIATLKHPMDTGAFPEKYAVKKAEEVTNIAIEWLEIPSTNFAEKVNIMFSSGDTPDMIVGGLSSQQVIKNKDSLVKIDEYLEKYAPNINAVYEKYPEIKKELTHPDGHIYSFMTNAATQPTNACPGIFWYNKEWAEKLNLEVPTTIDEYYEFLKAIKNGDPNENGEADEIPLSSCEGVWATKFNQLTGPWGIQDCLGCRIDDGKVSLDAASDEFYECLKFYSKLVKEGLYDQESFGQTIEQMRAKGNEGVLGTFIAYDPNEIVGDGNKDQYTYFPEPFKGPDGTQLWHGQQDKPTGWREGAVISASTKSPETIMRWMDYINSDFQIKKEWQLGERGKLWDMDDDTGKWWEMNPEQQKEAGYTAPEGGKWTTGNGDHAPVFITLEECELKDVSNVDEDAKLRIDAVDAMRPFFLDDDQFFPRLYEEPDVVEARALIEAELTPYLQNFIASSIINGITDADWEEHLKMLEKLKADEYVKFYQDLYDLGNK